MTTRRPPSYGEFVRFLENLPVAVYERRRGLGLSRWDAAPQIGISRQSLERFEDGKGIEQIRIGILMPLLRWLDDSYKREDEGRELSRSDVGGPADDGSSGAPTGPDRGLAGGVP